MAIFWSQSHLASPFYFLSITVILYPVFLHETTLFSLHGKEWKTSDSCTWIQHIVSQVNPDYKGVCHVALAQEGHCRPGEVTLLSLSLYHTQVFTPFFIFGKFILRLFPSILDFLPFPPGSVGNRFPYLYCWSIWWICNWHWHHWCWFCDGCRKGPSEGF